MLSTCEVIYMFTPRICSTALELDPMACIAYLPQIQVRKNLLVMHGSWSMVTKFRTRVAQRNPT